MSNAQVLSRSRHGYINENRRNEFNVCSKHPDEICVLFCKTDGELVCPVCLQLFHSGHNLHGIVNVRTEFMRDLRTLEENADNTLKNLIQDENLLEGFKLIHKLKYEEAQKDIKAREEFLVMEVRTVTKSLLSELDERWGIIESDINEQISKLQETKLDVTNDKNRMVPIKESRNVSEMFHEIAYLRSIFETRKKEVEYIQQTTQFKHGTFSQKTLMETFGSLETAFIPEPNPQLTVKFSVLKTHTLKLGDIQKIVKCDQESYWINCPRNLVKMKVHIKGTEQEQILNTEGIEDMTISQSGKHFFTMKNGSKIYYRTAEGYIKIFKDMSPQRPIALYIARDNCLFVSTIDKKIGKLQHRNVIPQSNDLIKRQVLKFTQDEKQLNVFEADIKTGKKLFDFPWRITINNINDDVCIVDLYTNKVGGRIVTLQKDGELKWVYDGQQSINSAGISFLPSDIVTTYLGNIVVCDTRNNVLHIINRDGILVGYKKTHFLDILLPISLCTTNNDNILIGCCKNSEDRKTKLHLVKFRGF